MNPLSRKRTLQRRLPLALRYSCLLPAALVAVPAAAQQRDSFATRTVSTWQKDVDRLRQELVTQRRMELDYQRMLGLLERRMNVASADSQRTEIVAQSQLLFGRLRETTTEQVRLRRQLETLCSNVRKPEGWLGVATTGFQMLDRQEDGQQFVRFLEPPVVASVDPGSPADRVGLRAGDVLLEIGGKRLLRANIVFAELLRPGEKIAVRLKRGREEMTLLPLVEPLPEVTVTPCSWVDAGTAYVLAPMPAQAPVEVRVQSGPDGTRRYTYAYARPRKDSVTASTPLPAAGTVFAGPMVQFYSGGVSSMAGLQLVPLNQESSRAFGVTHGLFVNQVLPGTPGRAAGLQGGDVLVSADSVDLRSIGTLQRVINRSTDRKVTLRIVRDRKLETVTLRW
jgi:C-terminal processing protease CtpA/Prc